MKKFSYLLITALIYISVFALLFLFKESILNLFDPSNEFIAQLASIINPIIINVLLALLAFTITFIYIRYNNYKFLVILSIAGVFDTLFIASLAIISQPTPMQYFTSAALIVVYFALSVLLITYTHGIKHKQPTLQINDELTTAIVHALGGVANITSVNNNLSRLKIEVNEIEHVDLEAIKTLGASGIFVAGDTIQANFGENSELVQIGLEKYLA